MPQLSPDLAAMVARTHGIVDARQLIADGIGGNSIRRLVRSGALVRVHGGVYRMATSPDTFESRCAAACRADPQAVISGPAGANLWDFHHVFRAVVPTVLVGHDRTPLSRGVLLRRTNVLPLRAHRRAPATAFASRVRRGCGSTVVATSMTNVSSDSPNGCSTITPVCRRCGPSRANSAAWPHRVGAGQPGDDAAIRLATASRFGARVASRQCIAEAIDCTARPAVRHPPSQRLAHPP